MSDASGRIKAFSIATRDPASEEIGEIAGVEFYGREFTAVEEAEFWDAVADAAATERQNGRQFQTAQEMALIEPYLRKRAVDPEKMPEGWLAANVPASAYVDVLEQFAPNLARAVRRTQKVLEGEAEEGKLRSAKRR